MSQRSQRHFLGLSWWSSFVSLADRIIAFFVASKSRADDAAERSSPTVYAEVGGGVHFQKSELMDSNDSGNTIGFGIFAGEDRIIGISIHQETSTTKLRRPMDPNHKAGATSAFLTGLPTFTWLAKPAN